MSLVSCSCLPEARLAAGPQAVGGQRVACLIRQVHLPCNAISNFATRARSMGAIEQVSASSVGTLARMRCLAQP